MRKDGCFPALNGPNHAGLLKIKVFFCFYRFASLLLHIEFINTLIFATKSKTRKRSLSESYVKEKKKTNEDVKSSQGAK